MTSRVLITKSALRKLPTTAEDGTPYCPVCRGCGELSRMVSTGSRGYRLCETWSMPTYEASDRLSYEQMTAGEPCRGCGQEVLPRGEAPSWVGKGTKFFTDDERAAHAAAEEAFRRRHPNCHASRWTMEGSDVTHCGRCCAPPPPSSQQLRRLSEALNLATEQRVWEQRREAVEYERHELERRLPGRARAAATVLREYQRRRADALNGTTANDCERLRTTYPEAELVYRWRIRLGCGDITEVLTLGGDPSPSDMTWSWAGRPLRKGTYGCARHRAEEPPYRTVHRYLTRSTLDLESDDKLAQKAQTVGFWTVELECGHLDKQITPLGWKPEDGHQQTEPNHPDEVARRKARMERIKGHLGAAEYEHALLCIEQGYLEPDLMTSCWTCTHEQPIVAVQRVGWLVPTNSADKALATRSGIAVAPLTKSQLEKRVAELEAEIARLKEPNHARPGGPAADGDVIDPADNPHRNTPGHPQARGTLPMARHLTDPAIEDEIQALAAEAPLPTPDQAVHLARLLRLNRQRHDDSE